MFVGSLTGVSSAFPRGEAGRRQVRAPRALRYIQCIKKERAYQPIFYRIREKNPLSSRGGPRGTGEDRHKEKSVENPAYRSAYRAGGGHPERRDTAERTGPDENDPPPAQGVVLPPAACKKTARPGKRQKTRFCFDGSWGLCYTVLWKTRSGPRGLSAGRYPGDEEEL